MGKSLVDMINNLGGKTHTRHYDICGGVAHNSTYATEISDDLCSNVLEVSGSGRIIGIIPFTTSNNYHGQIKVYTDNNKVVAGPTYYHSSYIYPFLFGGNEYNNILPNNKTYNYDDNNTGLYIPELSKTLLMNSSQYNVPYRSNYNTYINNDNGNYPILYDDSNGSKEFAFKDGFKILASQSGGTGYVDNYTKVLVIYDLYD